MTHLTNKNSFKINEMPFWWHWRQVLASVLARKNRLKSMRCHIWHAGQVLASKKRKKEKKESEEWCNWNVNKPYWNVNQKAAKSASVQDKRQFTHRSITYYYYIYIYIIFYIIYYRVTKFNRRFAAFRSFCCYFVRLCVNCFANVTPLYGHGEVMCRTLTKLTELFLPLFKCK